ncbi:reductase [Serinicoccus chungangensis]|uniref:Reductase n=1 Tax=Serinicoccus chungangensis TaxID=767452 RepID=A0A0W8IH68_9MICO|nr:flavin reductase family protein [Serinicoccus chungangensis]KUG59410.1 reductase [Serinicoccus chungangensis]
MSAQEPAPPTPGSVDAATYRLAMSRFASGVAVVTSQVRGHDVALTVDSLTSVSLEPVLLLVSLHPEARVLEGLEAGADFAVSVLTAAQRGTAEWLGETGRPLHDQLGRVPHHRGAASGMAVVDDALASFECRTVDLREAGDHVLALGEVVALEARPTDRPALVHYRGRLGELR